MTGDELKQELKRRGKSLSWLARALVRSENGVWKWTAGLTPISEANARHIRLMLAEYDREQS